MKRIGLALSGGGARGVAHLGILKALEEYNIGFCALSGTSAGAVVGALYSYGYTPDEILGIFKEIKAYKLLKPALSWRGILNMDVLYQYLKKYMPENTFKALKIPMHVAATDVRSGKTTYFNEGDDLVGALCASSCIPVLFDPVKYNDRLYIDGGILNNLPCEPLRDNCDVVIAAHSNPIDEDFDPKNARVVMERALLLAISCNVYCRREQCDFFIEPLGLETYKVMDINSIDKIYNIGYEQAMKQIEEQKIAEHLK